MKQTTFEIAGMHCTSCATNIQTRLARSAGVQMATVSFTEGHARVLYDAKAITADELAAVIEESGYRVVHRASI